MSSTKLMFSSVKELNSHIEIPKNVVPAMLLKSAPKMLKSAEEADQKNQEEQAYIFFMRFVGIASHIKKSNEYKKDPRYYDNMILKSDLKRAVDRAEKLLSCLERRYEDAAINRQTNKEKTPEPPVTPKLDRLKPASNGIESVDKDVIYLEPIGLLNLMKEKSTSFLVVDVRESSDFHDSHVKHVNILNIPEETLSPGMTAKVIERNIHIEQRHQWTRRGSVDKLILMDWTTEKLPTDGGDISESKIVVVKDALLKWDTGSIKCKRPIYIMKGGFENFAMQYPMYTTNPQKRTAPKKNVNGRVGVSKLMSYTEIEYPDLDNAFLASPSSASSSANTSVDVSSHNNGVLYPTVSKNAAIVSGAVTISRGSSSQSVKTEDVNSNDKLPKVPDRSKKPIVATTNGNGCQDGLKTASESLTSSTTSMMNNAMIEIDASGESMLDISAPVVDRSLKAKALVKMGDHATSEQLGEVLEAENDLLQDTLQLERKQLEMENRWEVLRLRREKLAEEEMKLEVMKKEEALLQELEKLTNEKNKKDEENENLRRLLEAMKSKMEKEAEQRMKLEAQKAEEKKAEAKNAELVAEKLRIQKEVEVKRQIRVRQQMERKFAEEERISQLRIAEAEKQRLKTEKELQEKRRLQEQRRLEENQEKVTKVPLKEDGNSRASLSRSHSSPNIAQMLDDDSVHGPSSVGKISKPTFSRTNKPSSILEISQARSRDFQPLWGTNKKGLTGLRNLGNTCYMNSILQCLSNFTVLSTFFIDKKYVRYLNDSSETSGNIAIEFAEVVRALWTGQYKSISPVDFKRVIGKYKKNFSTSEQQDAHELLMTLMDWLHSDINEVKVKIKLPEQKNEGLSDFDAAIAAWELEKRADKSFIRELFYGQWRSSLTCSVCGWASVKYESFFEMSLRIPENGSRFNLHGCIVKFLQPEEVEYNCPKCKKTRNFVKKFDIVKLPMILTVQFARFYNDGLCRKKQNFIDFPLEGMNFSKYVTACDGKLNRNHNYNLLAVCNHFGSLEGGHYTAYCRSEMFKKWFKFDDHEVTEMHPNEVVTSAAYILFYATRN